MEDQLLYSCDCTPGETAYEIYRDGETGKLYVQFYTVLDILDVKDLLTTMQALEQNLKEQSVT